MKDRTKTIIGIVIKAIWLLLCFLITVLIISYHNGFFSHSDPEFLFSVSSPDNEYKITVAYAGEGISGYEKDEICLINKEGLYLASFVLPFKKDGITRVKPDNINIIWNEDSVLIHDIGSDYSIRLKYSNLGNRDVKPVHLESVKRYVFSISIIAISVFLTLAVFCPAKRRMWIIVTVAVVQLFISYNISFEKVERKLRINRNCVEGEEDDYSVSLTNQNYRIELEQLNCIYVRFVFDEGVDLNMTNPIKVYMNGSIEESEFFVEFEEDICHVRVEGDENMAFDIVRYYDE